MAEPNDKLKERIRVLWNTGMSVIKIGEALGVSKNSVVGHAHRMGLPARPSPIIRAEGSAKPKPKVKVQRLDAGVSLGTIVPVEKIREKQTEPVARVAPSSPCAWPLGDPKRIGFHFCGAASVPGKPYCAEHASIAYVAYVPGGSSGFWTAQRDAKVLELVQRGCNAREIMAVVNRMPGPGVDLHNPVTVENRIIYLQTSQRRNAALRT